MTSRWSPVRDQTGSEARLGERYLEKIVAGLDGNSRKTKQTDDKN
jgi:hypothetical protein